MKGPQISSSPSRPFGDSLYQIVCQKTRNIDHLPTACPSPIGAAAKRRLHVRGPEPEQDAVANDDDGPPDQARLFQHPGEHLVLGELLAVQPQRLDRRRLPRERLGHASPEQRPQLRRREPLLKEIALLERGARVREELSRFLARRSPGVVVDPHGSGHR